VLDKTASPLGEGAKVLKAIGDKAVDDARAALSGMTDPRAMLAAIRVCSRQLDRAKQGEHIARLSNVAAIFDLDADAVTKAIGDGQDDRLDTRAEAQWEVRPHANSNGRGMHHAKVPEAQGVLRSARASTFKLSAIQWLWPDRFAIGKLGLLVGLPDEGKGQILADMAARTTRGDEWPCDEGRAPQGNVILLSAEDDASDTVVPRLVAAGADLERVEIVHMVRSEDKDRMFSLVTDLPLLRQKIAEVGNVKLVQIDPISAYLGVGKIDSFRTTDVRAVLAPLVALAAELKVAVVGIMHFNKKIDVANALLRISDSLAFGATARHVYAVVDDPENKRKLVVRGKNNLAQHDISALAFNFGVRDVGTDPDTKETIRAPHILWHAKHVDVTACEAMQAANGGKAPAARDDAKKFLADMLASGPVSKLEIEDAAEGNGITERTLFRAKAELGVLAIKAVGKNGGWMWQLPDRPKHRSYDD
jgi:putative DNA primase/helicase